MDKEIINNQDKDKGFKVPTKKPKSTVDITFKGNRKYDLHVARQIVTFRGREKKDIPVEWLKHPDFKCVSHNFIIKKMEVKYGN